MKDKFGTFAEEIYISNKKNKYYDATRVFQE